MDTTERVACPWCAEQIMPTAIVCPHCQRNTGFVKSPEKESSGYGVLAVAMVVMVVIVVAIFLGVSSNYG